MKKTILLLALFGFVLSFSSCKKGENDKFLSLSSRTARISGNWELTENTTKDTYKSDNYSSTSTITFADGVLSYIGSSTFNDETNNYSYIYPYSETWELEKTGGIKMNINDDGDLAIIEGTWSFVHKNKELSRKNKEAIIFSINKYIDGGDVETASGKTIPPAAIMNIDRLTGKEMVILIEYRETDDDGDIYTYESKMTFEKK